ncbi:sporulation initiation factor Spo0A [Scatolibacter rhodanostii]|uniref:sporulation initiation factor Spo0A n=1 Tax=Scatolibacter rhodanostii TaxID=2014781 RepID=UPI000C06EB01|nr:sporulation initiation factor Spo0A [Scatolibacter rhodanostii]
MKKINAEATIRKIALSEGITVEEVRTEIKKAMLIGLCSQDPAIRAKWNKIPCKGDIPTPEELIVYIAQHVKERLY